MANLSIDGFNLKSYEHGWILQKEVDRVRKSDDPDGRWSKGDSYVGHLTLCYASSLSKGLQRLVEHAMRQSDATTLAEMRETAEVLKKTFEVAVL